MVMQCEESVRVCIVPVTYCERREQKCTVVGGS